LSSKKLVQAFRLLARPAGLRRDGCNAAEVEKNMREAISFHLDGLREDGEPVPEPRTYSTYVELPA